MLERVTCWSTYVIYEMVHFFLLIFMVPLGGRDGIHEGRIFDNTLFFFGSIFVFVGPYRDYGDYRAPTLWAN